MFLTPKGIRSAHKNATSPPSETRTLAWQHLYYFIYRFPNKKQIYTAIFTNLLHVPDKKFVKNDLILPSKVIIYVNRNYINLAVKFM